eukprot:146610-Pelagomonas_calceolata.AAC.6
MRAAEMIKSSYCGWMQAADFLPGDNLMPRHLCACCTPAGIRLHVDSPLRRVQAEGSQRAVLAQQLDAVNELVSAVVPRVGLALGVLVGQAGAQRLHDRR